LCYWRGDVPGICIASKLFIPVCRYRLLRFLETLAYYIISLASRLFVYPTWRKQERKDQDLFQSYDNDAAWRFVAWRQLDLCSVGWITWILLMDRKSDC